MAIPICTWAACVLPAGGASASAVSSSTYLYLTLFACGPAEQRDLLAGITLRCVLLAARLLPFDSLEGPQCSQWGGASRLAPAGVPSGVWTPTSLEQWKWPDSPQAR